MICRPRLSGEVSGGALFWRKPVRWFMSGQQSTCERTWKIRLPATPAISRCAAALLKSAVAKRKRNIREDFKRVFGEDIETIDAVAMGDRHR